MPPKQTSPAGQVKAQPPELPPPPDDPPLPLLDPPLPLLDPPLPLLDPPLPLLDPPLPLLDPPVPDPFPAPEPPAPVFPFDAPEPPLPSFGRACGEYPHPAERETPARAKMQIRARVDRSRRWLVMTRSVAASPAEVRKKTVVYTSVNRWLTLADRTGPQTAPTVQSDDHEARGTPVAVRAPGRRDHASWDHFAIDRRVGTVVAAASELQRI
jgi:hypothetical protein